MKAKLLALSLVLWSAPIFHTAACSTCFGNYRDVAGPAPANVQHMAIAIWVLMFVVMSVLGGVGAFSFHLWRHSRLPIQPHEQLAEEDLSEYA